MCPLPSVSSGFSRRSNKETTDTEHRMGEYPGVPHADGLENRSASTTAGDRRDSDASTDGSVSTVQSAESSTELKVTRRKKHRPHHRCPSRNGSLTSIVKPSRDSKNAAQDAVAAASDANPPKPRSSEKRFSVSQFFHRLTPREIKNLNNLTVVFTTGDADRANDHEYTNEYSDDSYDSSVCSVDFSTNIEVHVFDA